MIVLGLTGSIGMGKSTVAEMLRQNGIPVFDSDKAAHAAIAPKGKAFEVVALTFPDCWNAKTHTIDRQELGRIIFADPQKRQQLENIIHPLVWEAQNRFVASAQRSGHKMVALDIPLLYETGAEARCDKVLCVDAPYIVQRARVLKRPGMTEEKLRSILAQQIPTQQKKQWADYVLETGLGVAYTRRCLNRILADLNPNNGQRK